MSAGNPIAIDALNPAEAPVVKTLNFPVSEGGVARRMSLPALKTALALGAATGNFLGIPTLTAAAGDATPAIAAALAAGPCVGLGPSATPYTLDTPLTISGPADNPLITNVVPDLLVIGPGANVVEGAARITNNGLLMALGPFNSAGLQAQAGEPYLGNAFIGDIFVQDMGPALMSLHATGNYSGLLVSSRQMHKATLEVSYPCAINAIGLLDIGGDGNTAYGIFGRTDMRVAGTGTHELNVGNQTGSTYYYQKSGETRKNLHDANGDIINVLGGIPYRGGMNGTINPSTGKTYTPFYPNGVLLTLASAGNAPSVAAIQICKEGSGAPFTTDAYMLAGIHIEGRDLVQVGIFVDAGYKDYNAANSMMQPDHSIYSRSTPNSQNNLVLEAVGTYTPAANMLNILHNTQGEIFSVKQSGAISTAGLRVSTDGIITFVKPAANQTTGISAGSAQALPGNPTGYFVFRNSGNARVAVPYYAASGA